MVGWGARAQGGRSSRGEAHRGPRGSGSTRSCGHGRQGRTRPCGHGGRSSRGHGGQGRRLQHLCLPWRARRQEHAIWTDEEEARLLVVTPSKSGASKAAGVGDEGHSRMADASKLVTLTHAAAAPRCAGPAAPCTEDRRCLPDRAASSSTCSAAAAWMEARGVAVSWTRAAQPIG
ncbi:unnamed protein product [Miscanthus lutarioriparius]|uniref:Uncharacterized protein n=1 Tax=Miscanthus lutarioriparius TaxID=422564 RepID=A0A811RQ43_9POAL|nr:unnamed protein product [Miscanthus lutarioriparius]